MSDAGTAWALTMQHRAAALDIGEGRTFPSPHSPRKETRMPIDIPDRVERARLEALQRASYIASDADGLLIVAAKIEAWLLRPVGAEAPSPPSAPQESA